MRTFPTASRNASILAARLLPRAARPTLRQLAEQHHISRERVRQIEAKGRKRLAREAKDLGDSRSAARF